MIIKYTPEQKDEILAYVVEEKVKYGEFTFSCPIPQSIKEPYNCNCTGKFCQPLFPDHKLCDCPCCLFHNDKEFVIETFYAGLDY